MDKRFWGIIGILVVAFAGMLFLNGRGQENTASGATNHIAGSTTSKISFVEYGDFQCSACFYYYPVFKQVKEKYADRIKFQFRHLPLASAHPNAFAAARAAEAASNQGKFWEMHDLLYQNQDPSAASGWVASKDPLSQYFVTYAKQLKLNESLFRKDFASNSINKRVNADLDAFAATKERMSTPTFFLNDKVVDNARLLDSKGTPDIAAFSKVLDDALAKTK